jgi:hypothetical protein
MGLDIKIPIGLMFSIFGLLLTIQGFITNGDEIYNIKSLGHNINLWSGISMLIFGLLMLFLSYLGKKKNTENK